MKEGVEIREVKAEELEALLPLGRAFFALAQVPGEYNEAHWQRAWGYLIGVNSGVIFAAYKEGVPVGVIGGIVFPDLNTGKPVAQEAFWYVDEQAGRGLGPRLLRVFEEWGAKRGATRIAMVHLENAGGERVAKLYERRGYRRAETIYAKEVGHGGIY